MGVAWKAFKVFLMVLGAIVAALFLLFAAIAGASWFSQSQRYCHETVNLEFCSHMKVVQAMKNSAFGMSLKIVKLRS